VLQEWVDQVPYSGKVNDQPYRDFLVGSALYWDDQFYGLAEYRTSSHPVTNKVDHRKLTSVFVETR